MWEKFNLIISCLEQNNNSLRKANGLADYVIL